MPDILKQVGPKQYQFLKEQMVNIDPKAEAAQDDDDDVPDLVGTFEDAGKKKKWASLMEGIKNPYWNQSMTQSIEYECNANYLIFYMHRNTNWH